MGTNDVNGPLLGEFVMTKLFQLLKVDNVQPKVEEMTRKLFDDNTDFRFQTWPILKMVNQN